MNEKNILNVKFEMTGAEPMTATELLEDFTRRFGGEPDTAEIYFAGAGLDMLGESARPPAATY